MDGSREPQRSQAAVEAGIRQIRQHMPETYRAIQAKSAEIGRQAFAFVRRGIAGEPNLFYAIENGYVVGTPFANGKVTAEVAQWMVTFACRSVVIWTDAARAEAKHVA